MPDGMVHTGMTDNQCAFNLAKKGDTVTKTYFGSDCAFWTAHLESVAFNSNTFQVSFSYYKTETDETKVTAAVT